MRASSLALPAAWRTPAVIVVCGCLIALVTFGPRSSLGLFLTPLSSENGWGRDVFALALAIQNLLWGLGQPFAGGIADKYGTVRVFWVGAILYALGIALMAYSTTPLMLKSHRRRTDRARAVGLLVQSRARSVRQAPA